MTTYRELLIKNCTDEAVLAGLPEAFLGADVQNVRRLTDFIDALPELNPDTFRLIRFLAHEPQTRDLVSEQLLSPFYLNANTLLALPYLEAGLQHLEPTELRNFFCTPKAILFFFALTREIPQVLWAFHNNLHPLTHLLIQASRMLLFRAAITYSTPNDESLCLAFLQNGFYQEFIFQDLQKAVLARAGILFNPLVLDIAQHWSANATYPHALALADLCNTGLVKSAHVLLRQLLNHEPRPQTQLYLSQLLIWATIFRSRNLGLLIFEFWTARYLQVHRLHIQRALLRAAVQDNPSFVQFLISEPGIRAHWSGFNEMWRDVVWEKSSLQPDPFNPKEPLLKAIAISLAWPLNSQKSLEIPKLSPAQRENIENCLSLGMVYYLWAEPSLLKLFLNQPPEVWQTKLHDWLRWNGIFPKLATKEFKTLSDKLIQAPKSLLFRYPLLSSKAPTASFSPDLRAHILSFLPNGERPLAKPLHTLGQANSEMALSNMLEFISHEKVQGPLKAYGLK